MPKGPHCGLIWYMSIKFTASIWKEGKHYVAQAIEFDVASQGKTLAEAKKNILEAVELYFEDKPKRSRNSFKREPHVMVLEAAL